MINSNTCVVLYLDTIEVWEAFCPHSTMSLSPLCLAFLCLTVYRDPDDGSKPNYQFCSEFPKVR